MRAEVITSFVAQAPELAYRTHPQYPLGKRGPLEQIGGNAVLSTLRRLATETGVRARTHFGYEVETVRKGSTDDRCAGAASCCVPYTYVTAKLVLNQLAIL